MKEPFKDISLVFLPVIHITSPERVLIQTQRAVEAGANGLWLINHGGHTTGFKYLIDTCDKVRKAHPNLWIGLNFLDLEPLDALEYLPEGANGLWVDNGGVAEKQNGGFNIRCAEQLWRRTQIHRPDILLFGGVAFKYRDEGSVKDVAGIAEAALPYMDVVTTSGPGTGHAADIGKIRRMSRAIGANNLGLASGLSADNLSGFSEHVKHLIISSSISDNSGELDLAKMREFRLAVDTLSL